MNKDFMPENKKLAEQLASFTDQILDSSNTEALMNEIEPVDMDEYIKLQNVVLKMKAAVEIARPDETTRARLRRNIMMAANQSVHAQEKQAPAQRKITGIALVSGFALITLIGMMFISIPGSNGSLAATAASSSFWGPLILIALVVVIAIIAWFNRQR